MEYSSVLEQRPLKIILIDDSEADYRLASEYLMAEQDDNYALDWSNSFEDGLKKIKTEKYDLCLMDYNLGEDKNGVDLANEFRENGYKGSIIMLSGHQLTDIDNKGQKVPFEGFIYKNNMSYQALKDEIDRLSPRQDLGHRRAKKSPEKFKLSKSKGKKVTFDEKTVSQLIVENLPDPVILLDGRGNIVMINKVFADLMSMDSDEILGVNACLFMNCSKESLVMGISRESRYEFKTKIKKSSMQGRSIYWKISPIENDDAPGIRAIAQGSFGSSGKPKAEKRNNVMIEEGGGGISGFFKRLFSNSTYLKCNNVYFNRRIFF